MRYADLTEKSKKAIAKNASEYTKKNYIQKNLKLKPNVVVALDELCARNGDISYAAMLEKLINYYNDAEEHKNKKS
ncbi:TPA: CopG family transcriptional regulator [Pasteurella multocida]|nr:CopG family transcriptional regulator [Pasteurella multocida]